VPPGLSSKRQEAVTRPDDTTLAARCVSGDRDAFAELYRQHAGRLYSLVYRMAGPREADDLLQEVFLLAHRKLPGFRGEASLGTWLYRLAVNLCLDYLRSRQAHMQDISEPLDQGTGWEPSAEGPSLGEVAVTRIDLERAVRQLPPSYRAAFLLHDVEGLEHREVGDVLGIAEGTSKSLVHKARLRLRRLLATRAVPAEDEEPVGSQLRRAGAGLTP
jgi:RNA polymerase sigma-70 factor, ECF subfamily